MSQQPTSGPYRLGARIAQGGMAEIYLAVKSGLAGFEKLVVIKRILPHFEADKQFVQMFLDEARLAAQLRHPGIVTIVDLRRDQSFEVVMEYIRGESLAVVVWRQAKKKLRMPPILAAGVIAQVADALHHAHQASDSSGQPLHLVHRDVTPSNIILGYDGQSKLIDFGIAKAAHHLSYTRPGTVKGKFAYSSPEQVRGNQCDGRSDVFALGVVFWELLTGQRLFHADNPAAVVSKVTSEPIERPSDLRDDVPPSFDDVVLRALVRDVDKRYQSAAEYRDAVLAALRDLGTSVRREDVAEWMKVALADSLERRQDIEKKALEVARKAASKSAASEPAPTPVVRTSIPPSATLPSGANNTSPTAQMSSAHLPTPAPAPVAASPEKSAKSIVPIVLIAVFAIIFLVALFILGRSLSQRSEWRGGETPGAHAGLERSAAWQPRG